MRILDRWRKDPVAFVIECIGASPDPWQVVALRALRKHGRLSVAACHGVGKDTLAAWCVLWVMTCFKDCKIPCTAPTSHQLYDLLWSEISKWLSKMPPLYRTLFDLKKDRMERKTRPETWFSAARTARKENSEALQGFHAEVVLVVVDEASGVPPIIFEVLEGALTGPLAFCLIIGNPTQTQGYFYDSHHTDRGRWHTMRVLAKEAHDGSPLPAGHFASDRPSASYVASMARKYGKDSNVFRVRVLGQFPKSEANQVIPLDWVLDAEMREATEGWTSAHEVTAGLDVARFGDDDSALVVRQGPRLLAVYLWHGHDTVMLAGEVLKAVRELREAGIHVGHMFVDTVGVGGGVFDVMLAAGELRKLGVSLHAVDAGAESPDDECMRLRDALWWRAREQFDPARGDRRKEVPMLACKRADREILVRLVNELGAPRYAYTPSQKIKVESKDDMRKRGIESPDVADAWVMTYFLEVQAKKPETERERMARLRRERAGGGTSWMAQ